MGIVLSAGSSFASSVIQCRTVERKLLLKQPCTIFLASPLLKSLSRVEITRMLFIRQRAKHVLVCNLKPELVRCTGVKPGALLTLALALQGPQGFGHGG